MEQASGVYATITSESVQSEIGSSSVKVVIPMMTSKGEIDSLNMVTAKDYKSILGYEENSAYLGLQRILESVSYAYVWRLNKGCTIGNARLPTSTSETYSSVSGATSKDSIINVVSGETTTKAYLAVGYKTPGKHLSSGTLGAKVKFTPQIKSLNVANTSSIIVENVAENDIALFGIYDSSGTEKLATFEDGKVILSEDSSEIGTYVIANNNKLVITIADGKSISGDSYLVINYVDKDYKDWVLTLYEDGAYSTYEFSLDEDADDYYENVDFGDLFLSLGNNEIPTSVMSPVRDYVELQNSNEGAMPIASQIDTTILDTCSCNCLAMNGITDYKVANRLITKCAQKKIHIFADAPAYSRYTDLYKNWISKMANNKYMHLCARPDQTEDSNGKTVYIYPSVNYIILYSSMVSNYGSMNFPPAGPTYGQISVENLIDCDYENFADELKTNRCNWQRNAKLGTMIWEQRTTSSVNDDFSYIAPVFIIDSLVDDLITVELNFEFKYMTPTDIINQESALTSLLDDYVSSNFLYSYTLNMPTYAEAQEGGRTLIIPIEVKVMKDSEVIKLNIKVTA